MYFSPLPKTWLWEVHKLVRVYSYNQRSKYIVIHNWHLYTLNRFGNAISSPFTEVRVSVCLSVLTSVSWASKHLRWNFTVDIISLTLPNQNYKERCKMQNGVITKKTRVWQNNGLGESTWLTLLQSLDCWRFSTACSDYYFILKDLCDCQNHRRDVIIYRITLNF